jgi:riboflavin synthase
MFTGIVTDLGRVRGIAMSTSTQFEIATAYDLAEVAVGASIACAGVCLTVVAKGADYFTVDVSNETLAHTTLGLWQLGDRINLERPLRAGDEIGGHIVSGHVDTISHVVSRKADGASVRFVFALPTEIAGFLAPKGSITVDGVSLTVNEVEEGYFGVNLIPHTLEVTSLGALRADSKVNIEIDVVARYLARLLRPELMRIT